ncbi:MAG: hypothetical protein Q7T33_14705 [Dehalococcoidia bacterium]|nr:hypothetical protein [Dehalococcoidia bacterium]
MPAKNAPPVPDACRARAAHPGCGHLKVPAYIRLALASLDRGEAG